MSLEAETIVSFSCTLIQKYHEQLRKEISPAQKSEICHKLHCTLQSVCFCVKRHAENIEAPDGIKQKLDEIAAECCHLIENRDLPMDTKINCAVIIILQQKITPRSCLKIPLSSWMDSKVDCFVRLAIISGLINTATSKPEDFEMFSSICSVLQEVFAKSSAEPTVIMAVARSYEQITRKLSNAKILSENNDLHNSAEIICANAKDVAFLNLEHHMDSVSFNFKTLEII